MSARPNFLICILVLPSLLLILTYSVLPTQSEVSNSATPLRISDFALASDGNTYTNARSNLADQFPFSQAANEWIFHPTGMLKGDRNAFKLLVSNLATYLVSCGPESTLAETAQLTDDTVIDVWYGLNQTFGNIGQPQEWINILGNVSDTDGVSSLSFTLNGGPASTLSIGPDGVRLESAGDFNIEIAFDDLSVGSNTIVITAVDNLSDVTTETVTVEYEDWNTWSLPYSIDWSAQTSISDAAQVVDGLWTLESDSVRPTELGYDRLIAIGEMTTWQDYEVVVPITIHNFPTANVGGVGLIVRWQGHFLQASEQPRTGWWELGAYGYYRNRDSGAHLVLRLNRFDLVTDPDVLLDFGTTYLYKLRVETGDPSSGGIYRLKVWEQGEPEPLAWHLTETDDTDDLTSGSLLLVAHHADASFGDVSVVPTDGTTYPLTVNIVGGGQAVKSPDKASYAYGEEVTLTAVPDQGWSFDEWSGSISTTGNPVTFNVTGSHEITATFEPKYKVFLPLVVK